MVSSKKELAGYIDHTVLKATAVKSDIEKLCAEAKEYGFCTVCVNPVWVALAADILHGSQVKVCTVVGFPLGANTPKDKAQQAKVAIADGADEVDMVANLAAIIEGDQPSLAKDVSEVLRVCREYKPTAGLKVIIEAAALTNEQIVFASKVCSEVGADFVKTSTGFHAAGGASVEAVKLMKENAPRCKVKAAGGIRTCEDALKMIEAGADRIGASASIAIVEGLGTTD